MDYYELQRQALMAERWREVAHLHRVTEARGHTPRDAAELRIQEDPAKHDTRVAFFQLMTTYAAFGLVVSPGANTGTNPS